MKTLIFTLLSLFSTGLNAEIVVIGNSSNDIKAMTRQDVEGLFMGRANTFPNGRIALALDQTELRAEFYTKLTDRPIEQVNAYWARLLFTGQASPPMKLATEQDVIKTVIENPGAIGYVESKSVDKKAVHILLNLN